VLNAGSVGFVARSVNVRGVAWRGQPATREATNFCKPREIEKNARRAARRLSAARVGTRHALPSCRIHSLGDNMKIINSASYLALLGIAAF
jgi:hypothetical protein